MPRCSAAGLDFRIIPAGFNAPLEFLTGFTSKIKVNGQKVKVMMPVSLRGYVVGL
jgi:hypothetical protein